MLQGVQYGELHLGYDEQQRFPPRHAESFVADDNDAKSSKIQFNMVGSVSDRDKWTLDLDAGEWVEGIALGDEWCYVATNKRVLRVITFSGYQQYTLAYPGPLVAIAARQRLFMLSYHVADPTFTGKTV